MNLLRFFKRKKTTAELLADVSAVAILVIDVQKEFCDPRGKRGLPVTEKISKRIRGAIPAFKKASVKTYAVYFSAIDKKTAEIDFFRYRPSYKDTLVRKDRDSAFGGSNIDDILHRDKKKVLLVCGFNLAACVGETVRDAKKAGYHVIVMDDLTGDDKWNSGNNAKAREKELAKLKKRGIRIEKSETLLKILKG